MLSGRGVLRGWRVPAQNEDDLVAVVGPRRHRVRVARDAVADHPAPCGRQLGDVGLEGDLVVHHLVRVRVRVRIRARIRVGLRLRVRLRVTRSPCARAGRSTDATSW